jgi:hypothetical protein
MTSRKQDNATGKRVRFSSTSEKEWMNREAKKQMQVASQSADKDAVRSIESILRPQPKDELLRQLDQRTRAILK